jgi:hypothetical protein
MRKKISPNTGRIFSLLALSLIVLSGCAYVRAGVRGALHYADSPPPPSSTGAPLVVLPTVTPRPTDTPSPEPTATATGGAEHAVTPISLSGPAAQRNAEFSGMAWYGDTLILLPQYPDYFTRDGQGVLFGLPKEQIIAYLDGARNAPLEPLQIPFSAPGLAASLPGFEGYEGIAFEGDRIYLTVEAETWEGSSGYLVSGWMAPDLSGVTLDPTQVAAIPNQSGLGNKSDEALVITPNEILTIHEVNAPAYNPAPVAHRFDKELSPLTPASFPSVEYRITDATQMDEDGRFWAINYFFPGDAELAVETDPIAEESGQDATHANRPQVERLLEFRYDGEQVVQTDAPPIQLALTLLARNWEGIARLDDRGFLLVTDQFPETTLGFIASE